MKLPTWDLLICTIPHRHARLLELLADLDRQVTGLFEGQSPGIRALLYRDNLTHSYGHKTQALVNASEADYVSCADDDDLFAPDGLARIWLALQSRPDYVGFCVRWTQDGQPKLPVEHSLRHPRWDNGSDIFRRTIMQFNPIRRDIALDGTWEGGYEAERRWGDQVTAAGRCKTEAWLPEPAVYWYRESTADTFKTARVPMPPDAILPLPAYPWLTVLTAEGSV